MRETAVIRGRAIAHYLEHGMRDSYAMEKTKDSTPAAPAPPTGATDFFQYRQGGGAE